MSLVDIIKTLAMECGFHAVGVTGIQPFPDTHQALTDRLNSGFLQGSSYDAARIELFSDPTRSFPNAKSIISVALSYATNDRIPCDGLLRGTLSRFAQGLDYHQAMRSRLSSLSDAIRVLVGSSVEITPVADTGPMVDRAVASRAGSGTVGKNSSIITEDYGSWVVLGELITSLELPPDTSARPDVCGDCDRCIKACPTGALCAPFTIDVKRCVSYLTQSKGLIPAEYRKAMGTNIYGCDACQNACPHNFRAKLGDIDHFRESSGLGSSPELLPLLNLTSSDFRTRVMPTTAGWIRRTRFRRNVAVALGNIGDPQAITPLAQVLSDPQEIMRAHAAWALWCIGGKQSRSYLEHALEVEDSSDVRREIQAALDSR